MRVDERQANLAPNKKSRFTRDNFFMPTAQVAGIVNCKQAMK